MNLKRKLALSALAVCAVLALPAQAEQSCESLQVSAGPEPDWYADQCLGGVATPPRVPVGSGSTTFNAYALNVNTFGPDPDRFIQHLIRDISDYTPLATSIGAAENRFLFAMDSDLDGNTIYGLQARFVGLPEEGIEPMLGTVDPNTGTFTPIGPAEPLPGHNWTGLAISPLGAFATSTDLSVSTLYSIDLATGAVTVIGSQSTAPVVIDIAMTCSGALYAHDIATDSMYSMDPQTGAVTLIGPTGIDANFAQGMTVDRPTGTVYAYAYSGGGANTYGWVDLDTGAIMPLSVDNPIGEWVGTSVTSCGTPASVPTLDNPALALLMLFITLAAAGGFVRRRWS